MTNKDMAREVEHARLFDFAEIKDGGTVPDGFVETCDEYFGHFCKPTRNEENKPVCPKCGKPQNGMMAMIGLTDCVGLEWGIVHGEARCTGCRWPYRGYHEIREKDASDAEPLVKLSGLFLAYHPDDVTVGKAAA